MDDAQLKYATDDVVHLIKMFQKMSRRLDKLGRGSWMQEEIERVEQRVRHNDSDDRWRKTSGINSLTPRQLAIVRGLWIWRERKAAELDRPVKRVLRDDLIVEMARMGSSNASKIKSIREMTQQRFSKHVGELSQAIADAKNLNDNELPGRVRKPKNPHYGLAGQYLNVVLSAICREKEIAPSLVGSIQDIHNLISWHEAQSKSERPFLATGWRGDLIGNQLNRALKGDIRIRMAKSDG